MKIGQSPTRLALLVAVLICAGGVNQAGAAPSPNTVAPLSEQMQAQAIQVFGKSPTVNRLLGTRAYTVESVVPWYTIRTRQLIGAVVTARLEEPLARTAEWPFMAYDTTESSWPPYHVVTRQTAVHDVGEIRSFVDFARQQVVSFEPMGLEEDIATTPRVRQSATPPPEQGANPPDSPKHNVHGHGVDPLVLPPEGGGDNYQAIYWNGNRQHYNWDTDGQTLDPMTRDWPVTLLFGNNANVNKVKDGPLAPKYDQGGTCAGAMNMRVGPNFAGMVWDSDSGKKTTCCPITGSDIHFRVYADHDDSPDRLYNVSLGYYVVGTSHHDIRECGSSTQYGYSETAEAEIETDAHNMAGWATIDDWVYLYNSVVTSWIGNRYYESNGWATSVWVWP